jgi:nucleotide-binding universal stress UspA family protein
MPKENAMSTKPVPRGSIVVGVDGSPTSDLALDWAVEEATRRVLPLHIIHAFSYGYPMTDIGIGYAVNGLRQLADRVRKDAVARARRAGRDLVITWSEPACRPAPALVEASETAGTVVLGARGMSAARGVFMGSVSVQVAAHARCPVVIVHDAPAPADAGAPVVVGVDGSEVSNSAIAYAYEQASARGVGLTVVHAWWLDNIEDAAAAAIWTVDWQTFAKEEQALVAESLAGWEEKYPDVVVRRHSVRGLPVEALIRASKNACLVVVGTRGRGGFGGLLLGSVSQGVMHRAQCPVAIVHGQKEPQPDRDDVDASSPHLLPVPPVREHT